MIQHVNAAAAKFPRLQTIIQLAANGRASKEELAILGKVVAKINGKQPILATDINGPLWRPSLGVAPIRSQMTTAPTTAPQSTAKRESDSELSDEEPDMTGPKQVGGGPMQVLPNGAPVRPAPPVQTPQPFRPTDHQPNAPSLAAAVAPPAWPNVPRFLLFAFKDASREKVMIPLGIQSYISRKGGDHVTHPLQPTPSSTTSKTRAARSTAVDTPVPVGEGAADGTVMISFFTTDNWQEMKWADVAKGLPWNKTGQSIANVAATDLLREHDPIQAVTVTLEGLEDAAWKCMKGVMDEVEQAEMQDRHMTVQAYKALRKARFESLVKRVSARRFLQTRTPTVHPAVAEALSDKFALRPYRISNTAHDEDAPDILPLHKRKTLEPEVDFEMPVSFDALDEQVEEGAHRVSKRGRGTGRTRGRGERKSLQKPIRIGFPCEGCGVVGTEGNTVWRRGPDGAPSCECTIGANSCIVCQICGNAHAAGTLGPLKCPEARVQRRKIQGLSPEGGDEEEEGEVKVEGGDAIGADNVEPIVHSSMTLDA